MKQLSLLSLLAAFLAFASSTAHAQSAPPPDIEDEKSPMVALGLSVVTTAAGIGLLAEAEDSGGLGVLGAVMTIGGGYAGYLYTGDGDRALRVALVQGAGIGSLALGFSAAFGDSILDEGPSPDLGAVLIYGGLAAVVGGALYGIVDSYRSANRVNAAARARALQIAPTPVVGPARSTGVGLGLSGAF